MRSGERCGATWDTKGPKRKVSAPTWDPKRGPGSLWALLAHILYVFRYHSRPPFYYAETCSHQYPRTKNEKIRRRKDKRTNERTNTRINEQTNEQADERTKERRNQHTNERRNERNNLRTKEGANAGDMRTTKSNLNIIHEPLPWIPHPRFGLAGLPKIFKRLRPSADPF